MKLITISGLDGSGKSTQLDLIEKELRKEHRVKRFHMIAFSIANKLIKQKKKSKTDKTKAQIKASSFSVLLRKLAIVIDVFRFRFYFLVKSSGHKTDYLLVDRYFYDQIVNIKFLENDGNQKRKPFWQSCVENQLIQPNLKIYLKISPQEILKRVPEIEQGEEYLLSKNKLYEHFSKEWRLARIDGNETTKIIQQKIKKLI